MNQVNEISVFHRESLKHNLKDGYSSVRILEETYPDISLCFSLLQAGHSISLPVFSREDRIQILVFTKGTGVITCSKKLFPITEASIFIPDFDRDTITLTAGDADLEFIHIIGVMNDTDRRQMANCQYVLPRFLTFAQSIPYTERFTQESGAKLVQHSCIAGRHLGRYTMGWVIGKGPDFVGQHTHPSLEQWYFMLDGADFVYEAGPTPIPVKAGDVTFTPHGTSHGSSCDESGFINYIWFEINRAWDGLE